MYLQITEFGQILRFFLSFIRHGRRRRRFDHFEPDPLTLVEMGVATPWLATNQFNLSSFFQGIPGNDGIPGNPGLPGYIVSKIREKGKRPLASSDSKSEALCISHAKAQNKCSYQELGFLQQKVKKLLSLLSNLGFIGHKLFINGKKLSNRRVLCAAVVLLKRELISIYGLLWEWT